jgi:hypothetical protein
MIPHRYHQGTGQQFQTVAVRINTVITGQHHPDIMAHGVQVTRQITHHLPQATGLGIGCGLRSGKQNSKRFFLAAAG